MIIKVDAKKFDQYQLAMATEIKKTVFSELKNINFTNDELIELTTRITFNICCIIDDCTPLEIAGKEVSPALMFIDNDCNADEVISCGGNSYMHEYIQKINLDY